MSGPSLSDVLDLLRSQLFYHAVTPASDFSNQTVIVTGGNAGLGREAAKHIARLNAERLIIACRTVSKGEEARKYIEAQTKSKTKIEIWALDLASFDSVKAFAQRAQTLDRLDALLANAGMWPKAFEILESHEATITVNVISTFLLAHLLLPKLQDTAVATNSTSRITLLSSQLHKFATLKARNSESIFEALDKPVDNFDARYMDSKLLVMLYGRKLASAISSASNSRVCLNMVNPGYCVSALRVPTSFGERMGEKIFARSTDDGGKILVDALAADKSEGRHGLYIDEMKVRNAAKWLQTSDGVKTTDRVWEELGGILEHASPGCTSMFR